MYINNITMEAMLMAYRNSLSDSNELLKEDPVSYIDFIQENEETIKAIDRVLDGKEKLTLDDSYTFNCN